MVPHQRLSLVAVMLLGLSLGVGGVYAPWTKPEPGDMSGLAAGLALSSMAPRWGEAAPGGCGLEAPQRHAAHLPWLPSGGPCLLYGRRSARPPPMGSADEAGQDGLAPLASEPTHQ
jgi:hypothetical protein